MGCGEALRTDRRYSRNLLMDDFIQPRGSIIGALPACACVSVGLLPREGLQCQPASFLPYSFATTGASSGCGVLAGFSSGANFSQSHPSLMQAWTVPILVFFSTMNGAPHFGHGSAMGIFGEVKSQSGYREQP